MPNLNGTQLCSGHGKLAEDVRSRDAHATDAGLSRFDGWVHGDAVKAHGDDNTERASILQRLRLKSPLRAQDPSEPGFAHIWGRKRPPTRPEGPKDSAQGGPSLGECCPGYPARPHTLRKGRALNGRGRACIARKATMQGAGPFAASPALLQSAALGDAVRCHPNPGLARASLRPGLAPAARWADKPTNSVLARVQARLGGVGWKTFPTVEEPSARAPLPQNLRKLVKFLPQHAA